MKPKIDSKEKAADFNQMRQSNRGKTFLGKELNVLMKRYGFNQGIIDAMKRANVFLCTKVGTEKLFQFRDEPLYYKDMEVILEEWRTRTSEYGKKSEEPSSEEQSEEEKALALLKSKGYQLKICIGFDEQRFAAENPELYKKYLVYKSV